MIKQLLSFLAFAALSGPCLGAEISLQSPSSIAGFGGNVSIKVDGSIEMQTASGQPILAYGSNTGFYTGPLEFGALSEPDVAGSSLARLYFDGESLKLSINGGAYSSIGSAGSTAWADITGKPTTLSGYGITDAQALDADLTSIAALTTTSFGRGLLDDADDAAGRASLGLGTAATSASTAFEAALGNPGTNGYVLSSTTGGTRSWVALGSYDPAAVAITGGTINGATIGATTPAAGAFTTLGATGQIRAPVGSGSAPTLANSADLTTGINVHQGNSSNVGISIIVAGAEIARLGNSNIGGFRLSNTTAIGWASASSNAAAGDTFLVRAAANTLAMQNGSAAQKFRMYGDSTGYAEFRSIDTAGTVEMFVADEAGNQTQISPHAQDAPASLYDNDEPFPQVTREDNCFIPDGQVRYVNVTRQREGRDNWEHRETFAEHNARLGLTGERALVVLDWDTVQQGYVTTRNQERAAWVAKKAAEEAAGRVFSEPQPAIITAKTKPSWLASAAARKSAQTTSRATKSSMRASAFAALQTSMQTQLGIAVSSPADLSGKIDQVVPAARAKREGKPNTQERLAELEKQVEMLTEFVVFLSRK